jgi:excisionase family DNA binding protein
MTTETLNSDQCGELLHCTSKHVEELAREGEIPGTKIGREWIFVRADLLAYLAERGREEAAERRRKRTAGAAQPTPIKSRRRVPPALFPH